MFSLRGCMVFAAALAGLFVGVLAVIGLWGIGPMQSMFGQQPAGQGPGGLVTASPSAGTASSPGSTAGPSGSLPAGATGSPVTTPASSVVIPGGTFPPVSDRTFAGGQVEIRVAGSFTMDTVVTLNRPASISSGGMLWLQYGVSGATTPNSLITRSEVGESGAQVGVDGHSAIAVDTDCRVDVDVEGTVIDGTFECSGIVALLAGGNLGLVDIFVRFDAFS